MFEIRSSKPLGGGTVAAVSMFEGGSLELLGEGLGTDGTGWHTRR